jgi:Bacterial conjugation TrbI-like protein
MAKAAIRKANPKAKTRQIMLMAGVGCLVMAAVLIGMKLADNGGAQPANNGNAIRGRPISNAPGTQATNGAVQQTVTEQRFANLEAMIKQKEQEAKDREAKAVEEATKKSLLEKNTATAALSSMPKPTANFKIFDATKLGEDVVHKNESPLPKGGLNALAGNKAQGDNLPLGDGKLSSGGSTGFGLKSVDFDARDDKDPDSKTSSSLGEASENLKKVMRGKPADYTGLANPGAIIGNAGPITGSGSKDVVRNSETYLPSGTFFKVSMLNGLDAPTGGQAHNNPHPILFNVISNGNMPNGFRTAMKHCLVTASGYGDLTSERAFATTEFLSCIRPNGDVVDIPMRGYVVGGDGKVGIRGRIVSKQGQVLASALWTSILSNFGDVARAAGTQVTTGAAGVSTSTNNLSTGDLVRKGALGGLGDTAKQLSQYYISLAEKLYPVIEVDGGQTAEIVLSQGVSLLQPNQGVGNKRIGPLLDMQELERQISTFVGPER